ncbi:MAG: alanine--tRNA ligase-related protein [bacterium]|nr:alanine--tRNA ligase-related protein [bacterium]
MEANKIRERFLKFFEQKSHGGHKIIPSASLIPENDPSVLFTTAGMQQFKGYYSAPENAIRDFGTKNVVTVQKCVRTSDIEEVGDATHLSFIEMLGNFSFGGYGRKEAIEYAHEFITQELGFPISYVTIYKGEGVVPKDEESKQIWKEIDSNLEIREDGADVFWGPTGDEGPCGPTTEIYCKNGAGNHVEIWNIVFNEYFCDGSREKLDKGEAKLSKLSTLGIDTGMGLERLVATVQKKKNIYETDLFNNEQTREEKIVADHVKTSLFLIRDGVVPANTGRGYILRRLIRRAVRFSKASLETYIKKTIEIYKGVYDLNDKSEITKEENKFRETLKHGLKEFEKGIDPFILFTTYGFPIELTLELAKEKGEKIDLEDFNKKMAEHQKLSQTSHTGMFKGGLANHNEKTIKLHTAHHLLLAGLQTLVDKNIKQRGSNITEERLRMDFLCDHKLTDEEKKKLEDWVNEKIKMGLSIVRREMPLSEAEKLGAEMEFGAKYPEVVSLYFIEDKDGNPISKEFCGGPHVKNTTELGKFKIQKEEAVSSGVRRIKAVLL